MRAREQQRYDLQKEKLIMQIIIKLSHQWLIGLSIFFSLLYYCTEPAKAQTNNEHQPAFVLKQVHSADQDRASTQKVNHFHISIIKRLTDAPLNESTGVKVTAQKDITIKTVQISEDSFEITLTAPNDGDGILASDDTHHLAPEDGYQPSITFVIERAYERFQKKLYFKKKAPLAYTRLEFYFVKFQNDHRQRNSKLFGISVNLYTNVEGTNNTNYDSVYTLKREKQKFLREIGEKPPEEVIYDAYDLGMYNLLVKTNKSSAKYKMQQNYDLRIQERIKSQQKEEIQEQRKNTPLFFYTKLILDYYFLFATFVCFIIYGIVKLYNRVRGSNIPSTIFICCFLGFINIGFVNTFCLKYFAFSIGGIAQSEMAYFVHALVAFSVCCWAIVDIKKTGVSKVLVIFPITAALVPLAVIIFSAYIYFSFLIGMSGWK